MLERVAVGELPPKPHTALRATGGQLRVEHCITRDAFDGAYSILYRLGRPQSQRPIEPAFRPERFAPSDDDRLLRRHFRCDSIDGANGPALRGGIPLLRNADVTVALLAPDADDPAYGIEADGDVLFYIQRGEGVLRSVFGDLSYGAGDYLCVPRGILHRFVLRDRGEHFYLRIECRKNLSLLRVHRNGIGQLRMGAPYSHRDFRRPVFEGPRDEGLRELVVRRGGRLHGFALSSSPLDVVGWDGTVYPWAFPIDRFSPRVGQVHLPPDSHGTFEAEGLLISSFVPRPLDFHPDAIPCPYPHSSVDCDEVIFYSHGEFTSRRGIDVGSLSFHPSGIAHGPHPGAYEGSIGASFTEERAVMLDTFRPLMASQAASTVEDPGYHQSFDEGGEA